MLKLPNGATVLEISYLAGVVLACALDPRDGFNTRFITWQFYDGDIANTGSGHYFEHGSTKTNLTEALKDYAERVQKNSYTARLASSEQSFNSWIGRHS